MTESFTLTLACTIRPAGEADLPKLEWGGQYLHFREIFKRTYQEQLRERRLMLVADIGGYPVGQVFMQYASGDLAFADGRTRGYLYSLRVIEALQGQGLGTRLIQAAERALRARHYEWAVIAAARDNPGARRLYERLGFQVFAEDPGRWEYIDHEGKLRTVVEPCWVMQKKLA